MDPAVIISGLALVVSAFALGWNVYRDVILRARVRVHVAVVSLVTPGESTESVPRFIRIEATNHGPGPVEITNIGGKAASLRRRVRRQVQPFVLKLDFANPLSSTVPRRLDVGETATFLLPYDDKSVLGTDVTHIAVYDSFGREHLAPRRDIHAAIHRFREDFPDVAPRVM